jgi:hypothetical protein
MFKVILKGLTFFTLNSNGFSSPPLPIRWKTKNLLFCRWKIKILHLKAKCREKGLS